MRGKLQAVLGRHRGDLVHRGDATAPTHIGLQDVDRLVPDEVGETVMGVLMLAAGNPRAADFAHQSFITRQVVGRERFLDAVELHPLESPGHLERVLDVVPARVAVDHQGILGTDLFAQSLQPLDDPLHAFATFHHAFLDRSLEMPHALVQAGLKHGLVQRRLVHGNFFLRRATEQPVNGLAGEFTENVPQGVVDSAQRHHKYSAPAVGVARGVHLVPEHLDVERIGPDQQMAQVPANDFGRHAAAGAQAESCDALIGFDHHHRRADELGEGPAVVPALGIKIRIELRPGSGPGSSRQSDGISVDRDDFQFRFFPAFLGPKSTGPR